MAKYLLLYKGGGMPETEAETAKVMQAWEVWYTSLGAAVADPGDPFGPAAKSVSPDGAIHDGPGGDMASGFTILQAGSLDEAARMAQSCPVLKSGGSISIFETFNIM